MGVDHGGRSLGAALPGRQGRLLFAYLALHRDRPVRRDELAEALWSGKGAPPAYESLLAPPLSRLRKALGPGVLDGRSELHLNLPEDAWIDYSEWGIGGEQAPALVEPHGRRRHAGSSRALELGYGCELSGAEWAELRGVERLPDD